MTMLMEISEFGELINDDYCINCHSKFSGSSDNNERVWNQSVEFTTKLNKKITNFEALKAIYKTEFHLLQKSERLTRGNEDPKISMCKKCTEALATFYSSYCEFVDLSSYTAGLQRLIHQTLKWVEQKEQEAGTIGSSSVHDVPPHRSRVKRIKRSKFKRLKISESEDELVQKAKEPKRTRTVIKIEPVESEEIKVVPDLDYDIYCNEVEETSTFDVPQQASEEDELEDESYTSYCKVQTLNQIVTRSKKLVQEIKEAEQGPSNEITTDDKETIASRRSKLITKQQQARKELTRTKSCEICSKLFKDNHGLRQHLLTHTEERKFKCTECPTAYKEKRRLKWHMNSKHGIGGVLPDRTCQICGAYFGLPSRLKIHMDSVHATEKAFCCEYCGGSFPTYNQLQRHLKAVHENVMSYQCEQCDKVLASKSSLKSHIESVHLKERNFPCDKCPSRFYRLDYLKTHIKEKHEEVPASRERNLKCRYCDAMFFSKGILRTHEKKHTIGFDHLCTQCGASFKNKHSLVKHIEAKHSTTAVSFSCQLCGKTFKLKEYLSQHMRSKAHGGQGHYSERLKNGTTTRIIQKIAPISGSGLILPTLRTNTISLSSSSTTINWVQ